MAEKLTNEYVKNVIFEAFKSVQKGQGLGVRECMALDDYAPTENARSLDIEQHWWEYIRMT